MSKNRVHLMPLAIVRNGFLDNGEPNNEAVCLDLFRGELAPVARLIDAEDRKDVAKKAAFALRSLAARFEAFAQDETDYVDGLEILAAFQMPVSAEQRAYPDYAPVAAAASPCDPA